jgi:transposase-like protein
VLNRAEEDAVPLVDLSMVEQHYDAVREVLDGATVKDTAIRYGIDRRTLHRWLVRYASEGLAALADKSSRPDRCPHQMAPEIETRIVELRRSHPGWGPRTILNKLRRELETPPSRASIYRCLVRHSLIQPKPRRRRRDDYKRWERSHSMELWQIDVMGGIRLSNKRAGNDAGPDESTELLSLWHNARRSLNKTRQQLLNEAARSLTTRWCWGETSVPLVRLTHRSGAVRSVF